MKALVRTGGARSLDRLWRPSLARLGELAPLAEFAAARRERAASEADAERAITVRSLSKHYETAVGVRRVLDDISFTVGEGEKLAVLGRNGSGKSTLVKLLAGVEQPTSGSVERNLFMSWPLAFSGGVDGGMTGAACARFIARLYGLDEGDVVGFVDDFAELGRQIHVPINVYSSGMRMRLMFALTLAVEFDCFLIDEVIAVGDQRFHQKCFDALFVQRAHCAMVLVSHDIGIIKQFCNRALVLKSGRGKVYDDLDFALGIYSTL
jgi:capsular polysaccharide transport system ATP-binding protein